MGRRKAAPKEEAKVVEAPKEEAKTPKKPATKKVVVNVFTKIDEHIASDDRDMALVAGRLKEFIAAVEDTNSDGKLIIAKYYNMYLTIKSTLELQDKSKLKERFDLINLAFKELENYKYKDGLPFEYRVNKFDHLWTYGDKSLTTYRNMVTVISTLCDLSTREARIGKIIDLDLAFNPDKVTLSETGINNVKAYYQV